MKLALDGTVTGDLKTDLQVDLAGSSLAAKGSFALPDGAPARSRFDLALRSPDLVPVALAVGRVLPAFGGPIDADLSAHVETAGPRATIAALKGTLAGTKIDGAGTIDAGLPRPKVGGRLAVSDADGAFLTELGLGTDAWALQGDAGTHWPDAAFGRRSRPGSISPATSRRSACGSAPRSSATPVSTSSRMPTASPSIPLRRRSAAAA